MLRVAGAWRPMGGSNRGLSIPPARPLLGCSVQFGARRGLHDHQIADCLEDLNPDPALVEFVSVKVMDGAFGDVDRGIVAMFDQ